MAQRPYVGRLAPSPTGDLHQGIARTFLAAWLDARAHAGRLLLRIEDLDGPRTVEGAAERIEEDLAWLGLDWDGRSPAQSTRDKAYGRAVEALGARTYPCTCTRREVWAASAPHADGDEAPRYPELCRPSTPGKNGSLHPERPAALRFRTEPGEQVAVRDRRRGDRVDDVHAHPGDFVLRRRDGLWAYQLAVTVDDLESGVSCVVRGEDLWDSAPRQALLRRLLAPEAQPLEWLHLPLALGEDGARLSKRNGARPIREERAQGVSAAELRGRLAAELGLWPHAEPAELDALVEAWRIKLRG
ncbi:MAG: tRNA glutamyl-Q(34) synthetase GluQRS [Myxococcota bacterium]